MSRPSLIIGVGTRGQQVAQQLHAQAHPATPPPHVINIYIGNEAADAHSPDPDADNVYHIPLSADEEKLQAWLTRLRNAGQAEQIDSWFGSGDVQRTNTRARARLALFYQLADGSNALMYRVWQRSLLDIERAFAADQDRTLVVFVVADVGDPAGAALLLDMAHFTQQMASHSAKTLSLQNWLYMLLPPADASRQMQAAAYAALAELQRFQMAAHVPYGYPMPYHHAQDQSNPAALWRGYLAQKPYTLWYIFEGPQASHRATHAILPLLPAQAREYIVSVKVNRTSTVSRVQDDATTYVGTASSRSLVLPRHWLAERLTGRVLQRLRDYVLGDRQQASRLADPLWGRLGLRNSLQGQLAGWHQRGVDASVSSITRQSLIDTYEQLQDWLLMNPNQRDAGKMSHIEHFIESLGRSQRQGDVEALRSNLRNALRGLDSATRPDLSRLDDNPVLYQHLSWPREIWRYNLLKALNARTPGALRWLYERAQTALEHVRNGQTVLQRSAESYWGQLDHWRTQYLRGDEAVRSDQRRRIPKQIINNLTNDARNYYRAYKVPVWLEQAAAVLARYETELQADLHALRRWVSAFEGLPIPEAEGDPPPPQASSDDEWLLQDTEWEASTLQTITARSGDWTQRLHWDLDGDQLRLRLGNTVLTAQQLTQRLQTTLEQHHLALLQDVTLLDYLASNPDDQRTEAILDYLVGAQEQTDQNLRISQRVANHRRDAYLLAHLSTQEEMHNTTWLEDVLRAGLLQRQVTAEAGNRTLAPISQPDPHRLTYYYEIDGIDLLNEAERYQTLAAAYQGQGTDTASGRWHIFGAERHALELRAVAAAHADEFGAYARQLPRTWLDVLHTPQQLGLFWLARLLGLPQTLRYDSVESGVQYGLRLSPSLFWSLTPRSVDAIDYFGVLRAFVARVHISADNQAVRGQMVEQAQRMLQAVVDAHLQAKREELLQAATPAAQDFLAANGFGGNLRPYLDLHDTAAWLYIWQDYADRLAAADYAGRERAQGNMQNAAFYDLERLSIQARLDDLTRSIRSYYATHSSGY